jgi:flagellin-like hook-associated protein FlgL
MYNTTMRNVQRNANKLNTLEEQIASGQKINRPSDNPVGFTNALTYRNMLNSLAQQRSNMDDSEIYMNALERGHKSMNTIFERSQELAVQAASDTLTNENRIFIQMEIRQNLEQLVAQAQTRHKDEFIFSGKWTNQPPYEIKKGEVSFNAMLTVPVNMPNPNNIALPTNIGWNPDYDVDDPTSTRFNPDETVSIPLFDNAYLDPNLRPPNNPEAQRIIPGSLELHGLNLLERPNRLGVDANGERLPEDHPDYIDMNHPDFNKPDYEIDYENGRLILLSDRAKAAFYNVDDANVGTLRDPADMPTITFDYIYRNSLDMTGEIYREVDSGSTIKINCNRDDVFGSGNPTDSFKEMISLMQGLMYNDQKQISEGIERIDDARKRNLEQQVVTGSKLNRVDIVYDRNLDVSINNTEARSRIESVRLDEALSQFALADAVYSASLQAAARMMRQTLMNFL